MPDVNNVEIPLSRSLDEIIRNSANGNEYIHFTLGNNLECVIKNEDTMSNDEIVEAFGRYKKVSEEDISKKCSICQDNFKKGEFKRILPCAHEFHKKCIDKWFKNNSRDCVLCRKSY